MLDRTIDTDEFSPAENELGYLDGAVRPLLAAAGSRSTSRIFDPEKSET